MKSLFPLLQCSTSTILSLSLLHTSSTKTFSCSLKPKFSTHVIKKTIARIPVTTIPIPARDLVIDFGRHKGKMLGTLPSSYLKWVSNNLKARDFEQWAKLADQVLNDPVYRDRIEWELAEKLLNGDVSSSSSRSDGAVSELLEISQRFGWDNEDKVGWSKIDFGLLGTSKGGRIPRRRRLSENVGVERELTRLKREEVNVFDGEETGGGTRSRERRRQRVRVKRGGLRLGTTEKTMRLGYGGKCDQDDHKNGNGGFEEEEEEEEGEEVSQVTFARRNQEERTVENRSPFPGRESLLKKVLVNNRKRLS